MKTLEIPSNENIGATIVEAVTEDAEGIQTLVSEASKGMYELCGWSPEEISNHFSPEKIKEGADKMEKSIAAFTESDILYVAKDNNGKIVGCCFAGRQENVNKIEAVYVAQEFQGVGLSKKLFYEAYKLLNPENDTVLDVFSLNSKAINFYKKLGFSETGKKFSDEKYTGSEGKALEITEMMLPGKRDKVSLAMEYTPLPPNN